MSDKQYNWAVIGAGPAGIAAVGKLLDCQVDPEELIWIDPQFKVGDFGEKWQAVPSNTTVGLFLQFLHGVKSFHYMEAHHDFKLGKLDTDSRCLLKEVAGPLEWVTRRLQQQVVTMQRTVQKITLRNKRWHLELGNQTISVKQVILAIGSEPRVLDYEDLELIDYDVAMDPQKLALACTPDDRVAVFGSSHSAVLAMRNLVNAGVKNIVNFYQSPLRYAIPMKDWILYDDTGLKGETAKWAHDYLDTDAIPTLVRCHANAEALARHLPDCNKVIYGIGFDRRHSLVLEGASLDHYDRHTGIIAPGLFGCGIAYPEAYVTQVNSVSNRVGLWKFMDYLNRMLPIWLRYEA